MPTIDILGIPHAYELTAPTRIPHVLVFIHGWLLSREYWQPLIERLSSEYQCLSYDLRGFGHSKPDPALEMPAHQDVATRSKAIVPATAIVPLLVSITKGLPKQQRSSVSANLLEQVIAPKYTPITYAQDLHILLQKLNISSAWLVGHSLGGTIALWGATQMTCSIAGVVCLNAGGGIYLKEEFERFRAVGQRILKFRPGWLMYLPLIDLLFSRVNVAQPVDLRWGRQRVVDFVRADPEAALGALLAFTTEAEVHLLPQIVARIKQPAYFITGNRDSVMEPKYVRHLASFHTMFQAGSDNVVEIPNCGHMAMIEHPAIVADQVQAILAKHL